MKRSCENCKHYYWNKSKLDRLGQGIPCDENCIKQFEDYWEEVKDG